MTKRVLAILTLLILALLFIGSAYSEVQSRPYGEPLVAPSPEDDELEPSPYLSALPLAAPLPEPTKRAPSDASLGTKRFVRPGF